jgi:hypothetical protein
MYLVISKKMYKNCFKDLILQYLLMVLQDQEKHLLYLEVQSKNNKKVYVI